MSENEHLLVLAGRLHDLTREGRITWEETIDDDSYRTHLGTSTVGVEMVEFNYEGEPLTNYRFYILNAKGKLLDEIVLNIRESGVLKNLHAEARRSALGVDEVYKELYRVLDDLEAS